MFTMPNGFLQEKIVVGKSREGDSVPLAFLLYSLCVCVCSFYILFVYVSVYNVYTCTMCVILCGGECEGTERTSALLPDFSPFY